MTSVTTRPVTRDVPGMLRGTLRQARQWLADFYRRRRFKKLLELDDRMLADIGLTREEVVWAAGLPLADNASVLAHHRARVRRRGEGRVILTSL